MISVDMDEGMRIYSLHVRAGGTPGGSFPFGPRRQGMLGMGPSGPAPTGRSWQSVVLWLGRGAFPSSFGKGAAQREEPYGPPASRTRLMAHPGVAARGG